MSCRRAARSRCRCCRSSCSAPAGASGRACSRPSRSACCSCFWTAHTPGDYIFAFTVLGFAGLFSKKRFGFFYGTLLGSALRFLVHYVVGATVWGEYMPETFFGMTMTSPWFYSALYNGSYMVLDCALVLLVGWILWKPMGKYIRGDDIKALRGDGKDAK